MFSLKFTPPYGFLITQTLAVQAILQVATVNYCIDDDSPTFTGDGKLESRQFVLLSTTYRTVNLQLSFSEPSVLDED